MGEHTLGIDLGIDRLLFDAAKAVAGGPARRMAANTAFNLLALGVALQILDLARGERVRNWLVMAVFVSSMPTLIGYSIGSDHFFGRSMALPSAMASVLLGCGILLLHPGTKLLSLILSGDLGGTMARRLLLASAAIPIALSWLTLLGQEVGLYDSNFGLGLFGLTVVVVFAFFVLWTAARLSRMDADRGAVMTALQESEARYRQIFENSPQPMWIFDLETLAIMAVNNTAVGDYGYSRTEFLQMTIRDLRLPEDVPLLLDHLSHSDRGDRVEWRHKKKDGTSIHVQISARHLSFEGKRASLVVVNDITARRKAEETFRAVTETANDAIISADSGGRITYFNRHAELIFGYSRDEVVGEVLTELMPERFQDAHAEGFRRFLATGEAQVVGQTVELAGKRKDNTEFPLELSLATYTVAGERFFTAIIRDITERLSAERELRDAKESAEAANKELEAFAYSVSHDLRAPLRSIDGFSQALLQECAQSLDDLGRDYLNRVCRSVGQMASLIDDLLTLSRVTRAELHRETVDLGRLALEIAQELQTRESRRRVRFSIADGLVATGDPRLLRVLLQNLLENAWKFTAKRDAARIEVGVQNHRRSPVFFVRDNGAGFNMAYAAKLFGAFQRLHTTNEFPGTGIGLATVQRIAHRHGGKVWAEGAVEQGASVYFQLVKEED